MPVVNIVMDVLIKVKLEDNAIATALNMVNPALACINAGTIIII